jgi:hypothetical protein
VAGIGEIVGMLPMDQIAQRLGTDRGNAQAAVEAALPTLLAGMRQNADAGGEGDLRAAIAGHNNDLLDGGVSLDRVDTADGAKIVDHVLGDKQETLAARLNGASPAGIDLGSLVQRVLPILAPIVLAYLAKQFGQGPASSTGANNTEGGPGGVLDGLGGLLGGRAASDAQSQPDLGGLLGGLLGGSGAGQANAGGQGVDLGGILDGLFGKR